MSNVAAREATCQVQLIPDGPALIRGADTIRDADGTYHPVTRPVVAVCVCGLTQRQPWCDGTHKAAQLVARARDRARATAAETDDEKFNGGGVADRVELS